MALGLVGFALVIGGPVLGDWDQCVTYENSTWTWVQGYGAACGGSGNGCTECSTAGGRTCIDLADGEVCEQFDIP